jgi:hypothetical protein
MILRTVFVSWLNIQKNKIFNDGIYEYDSIGFPFLAELGRQLHQKTKQ